MLPIKRSVPKSVSMQAVGEQNESTHLGAWLTRGSAWYRGKLYVLNSSLVVTPGQVSSLGVPVEEIDNSVSQSVDVCRAYTHISMSVRKSKWSSRFHWCLTKDAEYEVKLILHSWSGEERSASDHFIKDTAHTPGQRDEISKHTSVQNTPHV